MNKNRRLYLSDDMTEGIVQPIIEVLHDYTARKPIHLFINSGGGETSAGTAIIQAIRSIKAPVYTIAMGNAGSAAAEVFFSGNKRFAYRDSMFLIHQESIKLEGDSGVSKFRGAVDYLDKNYKNSLAYYKGFKGTIQQLKKMIDKETWLTAEEAVKVGLVDKIIEKLEDIV